MRAMAVREAFLERVALDKASKLLVKPEAQAPREARARAQAIREAYFERDAAFQAEKAARPEWKLQLPRRNIAWFSSEERAQNLRKAEALREAYSEGAGVEDQRWQSQVQDTPSLPQGKRRKPLSGSL